jgi:hypothetical protein
MKRTPRRVYVAVYAPALGLLGAITVAAIRQGRAFGYYLRDPSAIARIHPMAGVVSQVGALLWLAAAVSSFLTASVLRRKGVPASIRFHVVSGILSTILLFDDLFQGHEYFAPQVLHIREHTVYAFYALAIPTYLFVFRRKILSEEGALMGLALLFLGLSMAVDVPNFTSYGSGLLEDGFKFLGIASWAAFYLRTAVSEMSGPNLPAG